jgi:acyl-homoserine-lactone acylase
MPRSKLLGALPRALCLLACLALLQGAHARVGATDPAQETARLHRWLDARYEEELRFSPLQLTTLGRRDLYDQIDDYSLAAEKRQLAWYEQTVTDLEAAFDYAALDAEGQTSYDFWVYRLQRLREEVEFDLQRFPMTQLSGPHTSLPRVMINYHDVDTASDMRAYNRRLREIGRAIDQTLERVKRAAASGVRPPRFAQATIIKQLSAVIDGAPFGSGADTPLWADARMKVAGLEERGVIDADAAQALLAASRAALTEDLGPAYERAIDWFKADIGNTSEETIGAGSLPDGDAYYAHRLRYFTTTDMSAAEIHQLGLDEVARIQAEMHAIMEQVAFDGSLREFFDFVRDSDRFYYPDTPEGRQAFIDETERYLARVNEKLPDYFGVLPRSELVVRRVEAFRERDGAAAFYEQGTPDGSRPGVYYMHLSDMRSNNRTDLQTTAYHEGNPGHHMQISIALERTDLPLFRNNVWYSGYGEGWALYAEQVAAEMGVYDDPYYEFGRLVSEIFRAIRLVVDTGIHAMGWSEEQAVQYMLANSAIPEGQVRSEVRRYIVWPGQATAYKIGMQKILELRRYAQAMLGDGFDIRGFHDTVLAGGSLPLGILERRVHDWVRSQQDFEATVRRGPYGVAHITAGDYGSLGYGEGYAAAEDHVCNIGFSLLQARGELARHFGPDVGQPGISGDAMVRALDIEGQATAAFAAQAPELKRWLAGFAAGYNRYLNDHPGTRNDSWCSGAAWLREISPMDIMARMVLVAQTLPRMSGAVAAAQPPTGDDGTATAALAAAAQGDLYAALDAAALRGMGSNAWAFGSEMTENGRGLLLGNPHYPWYGGSRFWEKHLTIPGKLDVYGAHLLGAPGVAIGFNKAVAWSHTVSASQRIVLYRLRLVEGDSTRYHYGDGTRAIEERRVNVPVQRADGVIELSPVSLWFSHFGPMLTLPNAGWGDAYAYTARDANAGNYSLLAQWRAMDEADSMDAFIDAHRRYNAMPWVNTMATSEDGRAVYLDNSTVGHLSAAAQEAWRASLDEDRLAAGLHQQRGLVLLDGSDPENEWLDDPATPLRGTVPFDERPLIERDDYIFNANDGYWLSSPRDPRKGYSILYGPTETARSLRTRMNIRLLENRYGDAGEDGRFDRREIQQALFANRGLAAELLLPELVAACRAAATDDASLAGACDTLAAYDGTLDLDSAGAVLFREWLTRYAYAETMAAGELLASPFDPEQPADTPRGLGDGERAVRELRAALDVLAAAKLPVDASLRDAQFAWRGGRAIPVHGGNRFEGVANLQVAGDPNRGSVGSMPPSGVAGVAPVPVADSAYLTDAGYPIVHGSSFILTVAFEDDGPSAEALLTYSQSGNPNSPHFADQTHLYAKKQWRSVAFTPEDVERDTRSLRVLRSGD